MHAVVGPGGWSLDGAPPHWGAFAGERDPLLAAARSFVGARNPRLPRLDRSTLSALVAAHLILEASRLAPRSLFVAAEDGSMVTDRAYWETACRGGGVEASPMLFAATLPSAVAGELAMTFGLHGPCVVLAGAGSFDLCETAASPAVGASAVGPRLDVRQRGWNGAGDGETNARMGPSCEPAP